MPTEVTIFLLGLALAGASACAIFLALVRASLLREIAELRTPLGALLNTHYKANQFIDIEFHARNLEKYGYGVVSCRESRSGEPVIFDRQLQVLPNLPEGKVLP